ncbi:hypothetical protein TDB9533_01622 [Thalassocella blandensis]|nr:hypothetical protein TDB9533_01622 [Thalassocella blandensis]
MLNVLGVNLVRPVCVLGGIYDLIAKVEDDSTAEREGGLDRIRYFLCFIQYADQCHPLHYV